MVELRPGWVAELACGQPDLAAFEASVLDALERHIGFDVALFCGGDGVGAARGLDPSVRPRAAERWADMSGECLELLSPARRNGGVIIDSEWFGARLERQVFYETMMLPHQGRTTLITFLECQGRLLGELMIGRCHGSPAFRPRHVEALQQLAPVLSLSLRAYVGEGGWQDKGGHCRAPANPAPASWRGVTEGLSRAPLTAREREVLGYLHLGYSNQQIAAALGSAPRTVRNQLSRVYEKLGVGTRAEAVAWALGQGQPREPRSTR
jgi:DNA-binding CsgD family transcriptional regulator